LRNRSHHHDTFIARGPLRQATPPSHSAKPLRQVTPPSHSAKSLRQLTPPTHSANSLRQVAPPSRTAKSHRRDTPPRHSPPGRGWPKAGRGIAWSLAKTRQNCGRIGGSVTEQERLSPKRACRARSTSPGRRPGFRPPDRPGPVGAVHRGRAESAGSRHSARTSPVPAFHQHSGRGKGWKPFPPLQRPTSSVIPHQTHSTKPTPPTHSANSLRQLTPPTHSAKSLRQVATPLQGEPVGWFGDPASFGTEPVVIADALGSSGSWLPRDSATGLPPDRPFENYPSVAFFFFFFAGWIPCVFSQRSS
jgi:hypothetical protein